MTTSNGVTDSDAYDFLNVQRGDLIEFEQYAGRGLRGPEYRRARGRVHLVGPEGPVVTTRSEAMPTVVTRERFVRRVPRSGYRDNPALLGVVSNPPRARREVQCECEDARHGSEGCRKIASREVRTMHGTYQMCAQCTKEFPEEFLAEGEAFRQAVQEWAEKPGRLRFTRENPEPIELGRVVEIKYKHAQNGKYYRHAFEKKPSILLLPDGRVEIFHPTLRLWDEFPD